MVNKFKGGETAPPFTLFYYFFNFKILYLSSIKYEVKRVELGLMIYRNISTIYNEKIQISL